MALSLTKEEKEILLTALSTERARVERAARAANNPSISDIYGALLQHIQALYGRVHNEVTK